MAAPGAAQPPGADTRPLLLYDGKCRLCDGFVAFLIKRDPAKHLRFCALQSPQAQVRAGDRVGA